MPSEDFAHSHICACFCCPSPPWEAPHTHHPGIILGAADGFSFSPSTRSLANNHLETLPRFLFRGLETLTHV